ncbi:MAG: hypothetical protein ACREOZ_02815 [Gloeomargaritales cyanobacterium]
MCEESSPHGESLRKFSRQLNSALALTCFFAKEEMQQGLTPSHIIRGMPYMAMGALYPRVGEIPKFAQI